MNTQAEYTPIVSEQALQELEAILAGEESIDSQALTDWINRTAQQAHQQSFVEWGFTQQGGFGD